MKRKIIFLAFSAMLFALCRFAEAQQQKVRRIGYLTTGSASSAAPLVGAFLDGLRQLGYIENENVLIEYRYADGRSERLADLATDLVRLKVEVIVATGTEGPLAARNVTATIPIVMTGSSDPLGKGLAETLARPGGNVTGLSLMLVELTGKRLEIFHETFPKLRRLAVLWYREGNISFHEIRNASQPFGFNPFSLEVAHPEDFDSVFALASRERVEGLFTATSSFLGTHRKRIIDFAAKNRLPAAYFQEAFVEEGGLMSYAANIKSSFRHAATFVDKILKGAKPADLPVEQPRKFELWFNLKTAKQIGVTIPPNVLARADRVIK